MTTGRYLSLVAGLLLFAATVARAADPAPPDRAIVGRYCLTCHSVRAKSGNFVLEGLDPARAGDNVEAWEKVVRKLRGGLMPPPGRPRPDAAASDTFRSALEHTLDASAAAHPNPGRTETVHRLNRIEYVNAIRDLLAVEVNAPDLLPADDSSYGFDNIAGVLKMSPALMERYLAAAKVVSRSAVGAPPSGPATAVYRVSPETQQAERIDPLPYGTRGGTIVRHAFPVAGEYDIKVAVGGGYRGRGDAPTIAVMLDGVRVKVISPSQGDGLTFRLPISGGPHDVGVTFLRSSPDLVEQAREPFLNPEAPSGTGGGPTGLLPRLTSVTIVGPYNPSGAGDTPSRRRIFVCMPAAPSREAACAKTILTSLARRAYRGMQTPADVQVLVDFYQKGRADGGNFEDGIEFALRRLLVSPEFLYRIEGEPAIRTTKIASTTSSVYKINDLELVSRLSFFLWSSIPDDELLDAASKGLLSNPDVLARQVKRMLADPRSETLMRNFGGQWLLVRNMATVRPGEAYSFAFDETLRQGMQRETELFLDSVMRENRGVMELLTANYTFVNERLAQNYGIPNIQGSEFRRVTLPADSPRGGLLGQGSILTVTSPAIRTSPVIRGKWILNNILGSPPPDPPPNVPALSDQKTQAKMKTMRERMAQHRSSPACASCHSMIDPAGFALENFDAIGRWRTVDDSFNPIDPSGALPDGSAFKSFAEFRAALASRPERFAYTFTEKLLTYALGRGLEAYDMPAVRKILADTAHDGYRVQSIILGIVNSYPFRYRANDASQASATAAGGQ
jgi:Protein of unknown function (DUF1592)/Protein of unknown function (DUF1588)/Protein of unknown function (DUF1585)/Protein of unknown function (DUF1587)/Protein of unknown function (DUF1595)/Planctomycete cytochrome C